MLVVVSTAWVWVSLGKWAGSTLLSCLSKLHMIFLLVSPSLPSSISHLPCFLLQRKRAPNSRNIRPRCEAVASRSPFPISFGLLPKSFALSLQTQQKQEKTFPLFFWFSHFLHSSLFLLSPRSLPTFQVRLSIHFCKGQPIFWRFSPREFFHLSSNLKWVFYYSRAIFQSLTCRLESDKSFSAKSKVPAFGIPSEIFQVLSTEFSYTSTKFHMLCKLE